MGDVIFAQPRHVYESYSDHWRLVELSGYPIIYMDEIDPDSDNTYIFSTPSTFWHDGVERRGWPDARARIVYYNLEWYADVDYRHTPGVEVWSADAHYAQQTETRYVPYGSHPGLALEPIPDERDIRYDVATLSYETNRRLLIRHQLGELGVSIAPRGWGKERHELLTQSRAMLHVHQNDGVQTAAPQRFALAAAYKLPIITEQLAEGGLFDHSSVLWSVFSYLPQFTRMWTHDATLNNFGYAFHHLLCERHTFKSCIEAAL